MPLTYDQLGSLAAECGHSAAMFGRAAQLVANFELRAFLQDCARLREEMTADLHSLLRDLGWENAGDGSETANGQAQPAYRAAGPPRKDAALLHGCWEAEERTASIYRTAMESEQPPDAVPLLRRQYAVIVATRERLRSLETASLRRQR